jgi:ABC-type antimicrobial peptide transport system permease subunit
MRGEIMFDLETAIKKWRKNLLKHSVFEDGLIADIELHLRDAYEDYRKDGLDDEVAFEKAVAQIGTIDTIAVEYTKNRLVKINRCSPLRPGRFMPALLWNYIKTALRLIRRQKAFSLINISGLAIGFTICMLIMLWVADEWSFDRFHSNSSQIYRIYRDESAVQPNSTSALTPPPMAAALKEDFPEIVKSTRFGYWRKQLVTYGDKSFNEPNYRNADPDFFTMFSFPLLRGNPETVFASPYSVVLTETAARKYFGQEDPLGKTLTVNNTYDIVATGIVKHVPLNSTLRFDLLSPFEILIKESIGEEARDNWGFNSFTTFVMLNQNTSSHDFNQKLKGYLKKYAQEDSDELVLQPLTDIHLFSNLGHDINNRGDIKYVWIFTALAFFVLLIAGVNFMNLSTARSANRAKEVGLRKVLGAGRSQLIRQFFGESVLMALFAFLAALILLELLLPLFNNISGKYLSSPWHNSPFFLMVFLLLALITGLISGSYPALFLSSFHPARILKGSTLRSTGSHSFLRKSLVVFQFSLSVFLIVGTIIISRQLSYLKKSDLGFDHEHIIHLSIHGELREKYDAIRDRFLQNPDVLHVTASMALPTNIQSTPGTPEWEGKDPYVQMPIKADFVDYDYFETFDIPLVEGRSFSKEYPTDMETAFIVNEEAVRRMGLEKPVVGKTFGFWGIDGQIIGVMKDAHFQSLHYKIEPLVFKMFRQWLRRIYLKIRTDNIPSTLWSLERAWKQMNPGYPFEYKFLDEDFNDLYESETRLGNVFQSFTALSVFIACLGLFGLASFMAEQKTKEIGIRKVLGSSTLSIITLLNKEFLKWILAANLIAWPISYLVMQRWIQKFAYRTNITVEIFILAGIIGLTVALVTVSMQTLKAARANPADSLKHE